MSMFVRSEKPNETTSNTAPESRDAGEAKRPQATAQPIAPAPRPQPSATQSGGVPGVSVISKAVKITGQVESTEDIQINGEVDGDVRGVSVTVGSNARIKGNVYGDAVELAGTVEGKIEAQKVVLTSTAHMDGDVIHQDIRIESGAYVSGHLRPDFGKSGAKAVASSNGAAKA